MSYSQKTFSFEIPGRLPGLNEIIGQARYNRFAGASQKKKFQEECAKWISIQRTPAYRCPVTLTFDWIEANRRRDIDNVSAGTKFILDALVALKRIPDDSRRWVTGLSHTFPEPDPKYPRVVVTINGAA